MTSSGRSRNKKASVSEAQWVRTRGSEQGWSHQEWPEHRELYMSESGVWILLLARWEATGKFPITAVSSSGVSFTKIDLGSEHRMSFVRAGSVVGTPLKEAIVVSQARGQLEAVWKRVMMMEIKENRWNRSSVFTSYNKWTVWKEKLRLWGLKKSVLVGREGEERPVPEVFCGYFNCHKL